MNIFTFVGRTLDQADTVLNKSLGALANTAEMAEEATASMLAEQREVSNQRLLKLQSHIKSIK